ncbi:antitoxin [Brevibacterium linens]|uniref:MT0933-like antitoxin protein n=1 Tax=Brevibacterium linens ATCC 9172 TaxID=1255617 RepID=A0A2H1HT61_BRELN|nr:antitoxin [Brevibacterium linens]KAB1949834.1 antitoxin [Brevibacterium linens ATCC 9172]SMX66036.1 MT0933-like antitoxin protein [Brevibacterium linens ATCC 9172]
MAFDKFLDKAKNLANDPKVKDKLNSDKAEKATDSILDKAAGVADSLTGGKHSDKIKKARDAADNAIGSDRGQPGSASRGDEQSGGAGRSDAVRGNGVRGDDRGDNGFDGGNGPAGSR